MNTLEKLSHLLKDGRITNLCVWRGNQGEIFADISLHGDDTPVEGSESFSSLSNTFEWMLEMATKNQQSTSRTVETVSLGLVDSSSPFAEATLEQLNEIFSYGVSLDDLNELPDLPGIYIVSRDCTFSEGNLMYIGMSSKSIQKRWRNHHKIPILKLLTHFQVEASISVFPVLPGLASDTTLRVWERELIKRFKPPLNNIPTLAKLNADT
jgi:hypothetical protein